MTPRGSITAQGMIWVLQSLYEILYVTHGECHLTAPPCRNCSGHRHPHPSLETQHHVLCTGTPQLTQEKALAQGPTRGRCQDLSLDGAEMAGGARRLGCFWNRKCQGQCLWNRLAEKSATAQRRGRESSQPVKLPLGPHGFDAQATLPYDIPNCHF